MRRGIVILVGALVALDPATTIAQQMDAGTSHESASDEPDVRATQHHNAGIIAASDGDFLLAEAEFRRALSFQFHPSTAADHAYSLEQLGRYGEAVETYDRLLRLEDVDLPANLSRAMLELSRRQASQQQATIRVAIVGVAGAQIIVDGAAVGASADGYLIFAIDPGEHRIAAIHGHREARASVRVRASELRALTLRFAPEASEVAAAAVREDEGNVLPDSELQEQQRRADRRSNAVYWILGGVVLLAAAVIIGLALRPTSGEEDALPIWQALDPSP